MNDTTLSAANSKPETGRWSLIISVIAIVVAVQLFPLLSLTPPTIQENRVLSAAPSWPKSIDDWSALPGKLDSYVTDHFPLRNYLISALNESRYALGYSVSKRVIVGKEGWLFYDSDAHLGIAAGTIRLDPANLAVWAKGFGQRVDYLSKRGIPFYMIMAPAKETIYPEYLPSWMPKGPVTTEIDDFHRVTREAGYTQLVDPRPELMAGKGVQPLYSRYDTHWTGPGGYIGYKTLMSRISQDFPELAPLPLSEFSPVDTPLANQPRDLAFMLGINQFPSIVTYSSNPEHDPSKTTFLSDRKDWTAPAILHTDSPSGKTLLLIRDSFSHELLMFLKANFSTIIVAHTQDGFFRRDLVEKFHPDIVVLEILETGARFAMEPLPDSGS